MNEKYSEAEVLLRDLGVTSPNEIDLPVIAYHLGALVKYCELDGCEARIIGHKGRAIIRVHNNAHPRRQRFSIAHEIGHWCKHKGMSLYCGHADIDSVGSSSSIERAADKFAADLILPNYLLIPYLEKYKTIGSKEITQISDLFDVSYTAVARKLIECRHLPACLVCYNQHGRKWFKRSIDLPDSLRLKSEIDYRSTALGLLFNKTNATNLSALIAADAWFAHREAYQFIVREDCIKITPEEVLVLITVTDKKMMSLS